MAGRLQSYGQGLHQRVLLRLSFGHAGLLVLEEIAVTSVLQFDMFSLLLFFIIFVKAVLIIWLGDNDLRLRLTIWLEEWICEWVWDDLAASQRRLDFLKLSRTLTSSSYRGYRSLRWTALWLPCLRFWARLPTSTWLSCLASIITTCWACHKFIRC